MKSYIAIILLSFSIVHASLSAHESSESIGLPLHVKRKRSPFLYFLAKRTGLLSSKSTALRFVKIGENDLKYYGQYLEKKQKIIIKEVVRRGQLITQTRDKYKIQDLVFQILELAYFYRSSYSDEGKKYPRKAVYRHAFFHRGVHSYFKSFPFYQDERYITRLPSLNIINEEGEFLDDEDLIGIEDTSTMYPKNSMFWKNKFGSKEESYFYESSYVYEKLCKAYPLLKFRKHKRIPENGGGLNYGFKAFTFIDDKKIKVKVKPAMIRKKNKGTALFYKQEPFFEASGNKIYSMLGFNTDTGLYCQGVRVEFTQKLLDSSKSNIVNPLVWDLSNYYQYALLEGGERIPFSQIINRIVYWDQTRRTLEFPWAHLIMKYSLKSKYVGKVKELIMYGGYLEYRKEKTVRYEGWKKTGIDHHARREVRALSIIDSWLGSAENYGKNSFKLSLHKKTGKMKFVLTDVGNIFSPSYRDVDDDFGNYPAQIRSAFNAGDWIQAEKLLIPFKKKSELELETNAFTFSVFKKRFSGEFPVWENLNEEEKILRVERDIQFQGHKALKNMNLYTTFDDLKFGVRLIASLSEKQILHAVCLSGLGYSGAVLTTEKLVSRRDELVKYFKLESELGLFRRNGSNQNINSKGDGQIFITGPNTESNEVKIPSYGHYVENGIFFSAF